MYLLRLSSGALYVGITRADRFKALMKKHQRNAQREAPDSPGAAYLKRHSWDGVDELRLVPDRITALLTEAEWTCALATRGVEVFGSWPGDLCPAKVWAEAPPSWGRNWVNPREGVERVQHGGPSFAGNEHVAAGKLLVHQKRARERRDLGPLAQVVGSRSGERPTRDGDLATPARVDN